MEMSNEPVARLVTPAGNTCLKKFDLYETKLKFYIVGTDKCGTKWRVLEIEKSESFELNICEDNSAYSKDTWKDLQSHLQDKNKESDGLKHVTKCYGIIGFIKLTGPYYMWLITKKRKIGSVCGNKVYSIAKTEMIVLSNSAIQTMPYSKEENRYKNLLRTVDLTKEFYFSYSYNLMNSFQRNIHCHETARITYKSMFTWNRFLTRKIWKKVQNTWTVALIYGFFGQAIHSVSLKKVKLILIARRSRHFAGTRFMRRGIDDKGYVANEVETEQIVYEDTINDRPTEVTAVVQLRGSIPLSWSQPSGLIKPEICLDKKDDFEATKLHFDNLRERYKDPITILSLVKSSEKKPQESMLNEEFLKAVNYLNSDFPGEKCLSFCHWDLKEHYRREKKKVLSALGKSVAIFSKKMDVFYCQLAPALELDNDLQHTLLQPNSGDCHGNRHESSETEDHLVESVELQKGILRSNCIDCLDRTNVAQYVYGLVALGTQLEKLNLVNDSKIDLLTPLNEELMILYEKMGDALALQYGGSAAHNKIFSEIRGQWKPAIQALDIARKVQRLFSNTFMDAEKQDGINVFLGYYQPQEGEPPLWKLDRDMRRSIGRYHDVFPLESLLEDNLNGSNFQEAMLFWPHVAFAVNSTITESSHRSSLDNPSQSLSDEIVVVGANGRSATVVPTNQASAIAENGTPSPDKISSLIRYQFASIIFERLWRGFLIMFKKRNRRNMLSITEADSDIYN